jgi:hypothetical protein
LHAGARDAVSAGDTTVGTAFFNWDLNIGSAESEDYTIGVVVGNYYAGDSADENVVVTISRPLGGGFVTGGGYLNLTNSAGPYRGTPGTKTHFGFNVGYSNSGRSLKGRVNVIVRSGGRVVQIKGNVMLPLAVNNSDPLSRTAVFTGKATVTDITDPYLPLSLGGNNTFQLELTDRGETGHADTLALTVWGNDSRLLFSSNWNGTRSAEQPLGGGNLVIH